MIVLLHRHGVFVPPLVSLFPSAETRWDWMNLSDWSMLDQ
jgi:hypothetical protein